MRTNYKKYNSSSTDGFGLIEIVIVTAVVTTALFGFAQAGIVSVRLLRAEKENLEATFLAKEALEATRALRDESWSSNIDSLANGISYYPIVENGKWKFLTTDPGPVNGKYTRTVTFGEVFRDAQDKISSGGTLDTGTRKVTARVRWGAKQVELITYITNFQSAFPASQETKVISFEDAPTDGDLVNFPSSNAGNGDPAQSFTTVSAIKVTKVELFLRRTTAAPSDIELEIRSSPTGSVLGTSQFITGTTIASTTLSWVAFRFPEQVSLNAATTYYLRLRSMPSSTDAGSGSLGTINWGYRQSASSPYGGGEARRYIGRLSVPSDAGQILDQYDFGFKVFALP